MAFKLIFRINFIKMIYTVYNMDQRLFPIYLELLNNIKEDLKI